MFSLSLGACSKSDSTSVASSDIQVSNVVSEMMKKFNACDDQEAMKVFDGSAANFNLADQVEVANLQFVRCDGSIAKETRGPVRRVEFLIPFSVDGSKEEIQFVVVSNARTCSQQSFGVVKKAKLVTEAAKISTLLEIEEKDRPVLFSTFVSSGNGQVRLSDSPLKLKEILNIKPGLNALQISFYGACEEFKTTASSSNSSAHDFDQCLKARKIAQQEILVNVNVSPIEASATYRFDVCESH